MKIWQLGIQIANEIFDVLASFPVEEKFGLSSQISRCSISIPSNIAEGSAGSNKSFSHFLSIALGSSFELETQLIIAKNRNYLTTENFNILESKIHEFQKMTIGFKKTL